VSAIAAKDVKELRDRTGAGMMACRDALAETDGDIDKAVELLRAKGEASAAKRAGAETAEGAVQSYIHANNKIGAIVEVDCQTDFVARNEKFVEFARDVALHIAAAPSILAITEEEVPSEDREREIRIATEQAADRPENVRERIVQGKVDKWLDEVVLLRQTHVNEAKYEGKTIEQMRQALIAETRENIVIRRYARFSVGG
jgi:elongation factor Ts